MLCCLYGSGPREYLRIVVSEVVQVTADILARTAQQVTIEHHRSCAYLAQRTVEPVVLGRVGPVVYPSKEEGVAGLLLDVRRYVGTLQAGRIAVEAHFVGD